MRAVHVGVGHDDDLVVAQLAEVELVAPDAGAERGDQRADLLAAEHPVEPRPLDVQDLAAQRQHRLVRPAPPLLRRAAGAVALDEEDLGLRRVLLLAVGELARQVRHVHRRLAPGQLARLARRLARQRRLDDLADDDPRLGRVLLEPLGELLVDQPLDRRPHLGADTSLSLVWLENFGSGTLTDSTQVSPSRASSPESATFSFFASPDSPA